MTTNIAIHGDGNCGGHSWFHCDKNDDDYHDDRDDNDGDMDNYDKDEDQMTAMIMVMIKGCLQNSFSEKLGLLAQPADAPPPP